MKLKPLVCIVSIAALAITCRPVLAQGQGSSHAVVVVPDSSVERPGDVGINAHTNHLILVRAGGATPQASTPGGQSPQSMYSIYGVTAAGAGTIAIVDAYDYPTAENDLGVFSQQFGLPACTTANGCFKKLYAAGSKPRANCGWAQEMALDIEWAHAMAPNAHIVLVEAATNSFSNLFKAVDFATSYVTSNNGSKGEVSMSWGGSEFSSEASYDSHFQNNNVVYFGSSGDTGGTTIYPSASPYVAAAGGTSLVSNSDGSVTETGWSGSGGGPSKYETKLSYQSNIAGTDPTQRSIPDVSFDADPNTGVSVYDSTSCQGLSGWLVFGGTSVSSPSLSGIVNSAASLSGSFASNTLNELGTMYNNMGNSADFYDVLSGTAGSFSANSGWDFVTGIGTSRGMLGK